MATNLSIASFPSFKVPGQQVKWTYKDLWETEDFAYFVAQRAHRSEQILNPAKHIQKGRKDSDTTNFLAMPLLLHQDQERLGWAEIHSYTQRFTSKLIFFQIDEHKLISEHITLILGSLVSATFFTTNSDQIRLVAIGRPPADCAQHLDEWGEVGTFHSLLKKSYLLPKSDESVLRPTEAWTISRGAWRQNHQRESYYQNLSYLENRRERQEKLGGHTCQRKPPKRGLLSRIFNPRINDSLF